ncbi:MAG: TIR domain-containing protein [Aeromicrobium sp.]|uniref:TIR domain-containing protein n=1 Tax=Aeromicrobium sp. TaxID=1871063 RepID=UPI0039E64F83
MTDVMLSYASVERDRATQVLAELRASGVSVWIDDARDDEASAAETVGIPVGREHWETIRSAIDAAESMVVVDGPGWRRSAYCQRELAYALDRGKWVVILASDERFADIPLTRSVDSVAEFCAERVEHEPVLEAHVRLLERMTEAPTRMSVREYVASRSVAADVETVLAEDAPVRLDGELADFVQRFSDEREAARGRLRRKVIAATSGLVVLAVLSVVGFVVAQWQERRALAFRDFMESLGLAERSTNADHTPEAVSDARQAVALDRNPFSEEALRLAEAEERRHRVLDVPQLSGNQVYEDLVWAEDDTALWFTTDDEVYRAEVESGTVGRVARSSEPLRFATLVVSPDGGRALAVRQDRRLVVIDRGEESVEPVEDEEGNPVEVTAMTVHDGRLWVGRPDGRVQRGEDPWQSDEKGLELTDWATVPGETGEPEGASVLSLAASEDGESLAAVTAGGTVSAMETGKRAPRTATVLGRVPLHESFSETVYHRSSLTVCGGVAYGALRHAEESTTRFVAPLDGSEPMTSLAQLNLRHGTTRIHCWDDGAITRSRALGSVSTILDSTVEPDLNGWVPERETAPLAVTSDQERLAHVRRDGRLEVVERDLLVQEIEAPGGYQGFPVEGGVLDIDSVGQVSLIDYETEARTPIGTLDGFVAFETGLFATAGPDGSMWLTLSDGRVYLADQDGVVLVDTVSSGGVSATAADGSLLVRPHDAAAIYRISAEGSTTAIELADFDPKLEGVVAIQPSSDGGAYLLTHLGELRRYDEDGEIVATFDELLTGGLAASMLVTSDGDLVVAAPDGHVRVLDEDLELLREALLPSGPSRLQEYQDRLVVGYNSGAVELVDRESMARVDVLVDDSVDARTYLVAPDRPMLVGVEPRLTSTPGELDTIYRVVSF